MSDEAELTHGEFNFELDQATCALLDGIDTNDFDLGDFNDESNQERYNSCHTSNDIECDISVPHDEVLFDEASLAVLDGFDGFEFNDESEVCQSPQPPSHQHAKTVELTHIEKSKSDATKDILTATAIKANPKVLEFPVPQSATPSKPPAHSMYIGKTSQANTPKVSVNYAVNSLINTPQVSAATATPRFRGMPGPAGKKNETVS